MEQVTGNLGALQLETTPQAFSEVAGRTCAKRNVLLGVGALCCKSFLGKLADSRADKLVASASWDGMPGSSSRRQPALAPYPLRS